MQRNIVKTDEILVYTGTAAERATLAANIAGRGVEFWETDTGNKYKSDGVAWRQISTAGGLLTAPPTTGTVTIVGTSQPGIARNRQVGVSSSSVSSVTWDPPGVKGIVVDSVHATSGVVGLTGLDNFRVRYAVDAGTDAAATLLLPNAFNLQADNVDIGQVGSFNLQQHYISDTEAAGDLRVGRVSMLPYKIDVSEPIRRLDFIQNTGLIMVFIIRAVEEV